MNKKSLWHNEFFQLFISISAFLLVSFGIPYVIVKTFPQAQTAKIQVTTPVISPEKTYDISVDGKVISVSVSRYDAYYNDFWVTYRNKSGDILVHRFHLKAQDDITAEDSWQTY